METAHSATDGRVPGSPGAAVPGDTGFSENAQVLWHDLRGLAHDHLQLAALETQRAGKSLINMVVYGVAAAILLVSAWLGLMAAGVLWLIAGGLDADVFSRFQSTEVKAVSLGEYLSGESNLP